MEAPMARCLPRYLAISFLIIFLGFWFLWVGLKPDIQPVLSSPTPVVEVTPHSTPLSATSSAVVGITGEQAYVTKVIDGDTIELQDGQTVRLIGIDTPETVDPRRPVGCFGKEASNETKRLVFNKVVILQKDVSETDKYGRLLRYVYLPLEDGQTLFVNDYLVRKGFAKALTFPPDVKFNEQFREAEQQAREAKRGLWGRC